MPRIWLGAATAIGLVLLYLLDLGGAGFLGPDEPRYASIGREMASSGDWVTPQLNRSPWFEKPPLLYWTTAIANRLGLRDEWAARLPIALESLAFLGFFFETLRRAFSIRVAVAATAVLGTSAGWLAASFAAITDLPMSAALGAAMLIALYHQRTRAGWMAGILLGLSILAKGFVPLVLFAPVWWVSRGKRLAILGAATVIAVPWYALCLARNGSAFWNDFFWKQHIQRAFSADALQHGQPLWYYLPVLLAGLFPWTPMALLLGIRKSYEDRRVRFLALWLLFALLFFSVVPNKLPFYVLPLLPALAIVLAGSLGHAGGQAWWIAACVALLIFLPSIAAGLPNAFLNGATRTHWPFHWSGLVFLAAAIVVWRLGRDGAVTPAVLSAALVAAAGIGYLKWQVLPVLDERASVRAFWRAHQTPACLDPSVSRAWQYGLEYYAGRRLSECQETERPRIAVRGQALVIE